MAKPTARRGPSTPVLWCLRATAAVLALLCLWLAVAVLWNSSTAASTRHAAVVPFDATVRDGPAEHLYVEPAEGAHAHAHTPGADGLGVHLAALPYSFGRWRHPVRDITFADEESRAFSDALFRFATHKRWNYYGISTERFFVSMAMVQFNYISDIAVTLIDKNVDASRKWEYHGRFPFGLGMTIASASINGCTEWSDSLFHLDHKDVSICYDPVERVWRGAFAVMVENNGETRPLSATFVMAQTDTLTLLFPLDGSRRRPAYVDKIAGAPVVGELHWAGHRHALDGLGAIDWTKSQALRETRWKWVSFSVPGTITIERVQASDAGETVVETVVRDAAAQIGVNLSADVYDHRGHSQENAVWVNGTMFPLNGVRFRVPKDNKAREPWSVQSLSDGAVQTVDFAFLPTGSREDHTQVPGLLVSDYVMAFGYANATIEFRPQPDLRYRVALLNVFGVMEDHVAVW